MACVLWNFTVSCGDLWKEPALEESTPILTGFSFFLNDSFNDLCKTRKCA